jgi:hypothetical protein
LNHEITGAFELVVLLSSEGSFASNLSAKESCIELSRSLPRGELRKLDATPKMAHDIYLALAEATPVDDPP